VYAAYDSANNEKRAREAAHETESRKAQEEEKREEEERLAEVTTQAETLVENRKIGVQISELISSIGAQATEMMHAANALKGTDIVEPEALVLHDISAILSAFLRTFSDGYSLGYNYISYLWFDITDCIDSSYDDVVLTEEYCEERRDNKPLAMVLCLTMYDIRKGTNLASKVASTYLSIVSEISSYCGDSLAVEMVAEAFVEQLRPYIYEEGRDGYAGRSTFSGSKSASGTECEKCVKGYQLLDLPFGVSKGEVKQKRDALAQVLHSDHTGCMSERIRDTAEEQLKSINVAYDHILKCRFSGAAS
jgi:hypothetical protein